MNLDWRVRMVIARLSAYLVDVLVTAAMVAVSQGLIWVLGLNPVRKAPEPHALHLWVFATVTLPVYGYFVATTWLHGASLGKRVLNLRVVRPDGEERPALARIALRYVLVLAPFELNHTAMFDGSGLALIGVYVLTTALVAPMLLNAEARGLHDLVAGTRVVRRHGETEG